MELQNGTVDRVYEIKQSTLSIGSINDAIARTYVHINNSDNLLKQNDDRNE